MKVSAENLFVLDQLIRITQKEARHLIRTADRLKQQNPDLAWVCSLEHSDERGEMLDAFVSRFGRQQDNRMNVPPNESPTPVFPVTTRRTIWNGKSKCWSCIAPSKAGRSR